MLKYLFPIAILCFTLSCTTEEKPSQEVTTDSDKQTITDEKPQKEYDPSSVLSRTEEFFDWYVENSRMLYRMRSLCIGAENGFHALDENKLNDYTAWLDETGFFSDAFIETEHNRWTTECAEKMRAKARKKERIVGPPPCVFEGDIFFKMQEQPTQEMVDELDFTVDNQTDSSATVSYKNSTLTWNLKNDSWKVDSWPN